MSVTFDFSRSGEWDQFVAASPQGNVFCESRFLDAAGTRFDVLGLGSDGGQPEVAALIAYDGDKPVRAPAPYAIYQGVLFAETFGGAVTHRTTSRALRSLSALLDSLSDRLPRISFCLHPSITDVRPFSWFHYEIPELGQFQVDVRYTAVLDLGELGDLERHLRTVRPDRRRDYREGVSLGFAVEESRDVGELLRLYRATFERQGLEIAEADIARVESIARRSLDDNFGRLYVSRSAEGQTASMVLLLHDRHTGYYLFGANDPSFRRSGASTQLLVEAIWRLREETGVRRIDMVGVNSPNRGDFKISLGASLVPYYVVDWERP